jgi:LacI family transcriptional regulator
VASQHGAARGSRARSRAPLNGIREVAQLAGVSVGTVSNVVNRPEKVAAETRAQVEAAIARLNFVPNRGAADLRSGRSSMIGLVVADTADACFAELSRGVLEAAGERESVVVLTTSRGQSDEERRNLSMLERQRVAGVLLTPVGAAPVELTGLQHRGIKTVLVDQSARAADFCSVAVDDVAGGRIATEHLLSRGGRRIVLVNGPARIRQCADRRRGARVAMRRAGLSVDSLEEVVADAMTVAAGVAAGERLLGARPLPDAIFCASDLLAIGVMRSLTSGGIAVPGEVKIIGYDDIDGVADLPTPLSSVRQPNYELGRIAVNLLFREVDEPRHPHEKVMLEPKVVERVSTAR